MKGKIITHVLWEKDGVSKKIPIRMIKNAVGALSFEARDPELDLDARGSDVETVRGAVLDALDRWHSVAWSLWFVVEMSGTARDAKSDLDLSWGWLLVGVTKDGKKIHKRIDARAGYYGNTNLDKFTEQEWCARRRAAARSALTDALTDVGALLKTSSAGGFVEGDLKTGASSDSAYSWRGSGMRAVLPGTVETLDRLMTLKFALDDLREKLKDLLSPEQLKHFLASTVLPALTPGDAIQELLKERKKS